jgi:hypothetical protein
MSKWDWVKYYDVDLIDTIVAKVVIKIEVSHFTQMTHLKFK